MTTIVIDGIFFQINEWSGISKFWMTLLAELDSILEDEQGVRIFLLVRGQSNNIRNTPFRHIHILPFSYFDPVCALSDFEALGRLCHQLEASVFISSYYTLAYGVPNIGMSYDFIPEALGLMANYGWKVKEIYMRSLKHCFSISEASAHAASLYYPNLECSLKDIFYPPLAPDESQAIDNGVIGAFRAKYRLRYPYAAVVGHRDGYKNVDLLAEALRKRPVGSKKIALGIVASSGEPLSPADLELYSQHFQFGQVRIELSSTEMPVFFRAAELLFYPSLLEGFGYPVAEALLQRCPVITTGATSIGEILNYADPYDYQLISGHDGAEALDALIRMFHSRRRSSAETAQRIQTAFGRQQGGRFLNRLLELAGPTTLPRTGELEACLSLDGLLA